MRQLSWSSERKSKLWQQIVMQKIINQSYVMKLENVESHRIEKLVHLAETVTLSDQSNNEGQAARIYFNSFFEDGYTRSDPEFIENAALNYGYTILHSAISRTIVAKGLIPGLGIHHKGERNAHNLASDFIEPFRPIVDYFILKFPPEDYLTKSYRIDLINLLHARVLIDQKMQTVIRAIEISIDSIIYFFETGNSNELKLPQLNKLKFHEP